MVRAQSEGKADSARRRWACRSRAPRNSPHSRTHPIYHPYFAAFSHPFSCTGAFAGWSWWRELGIGRRRRWEADLRDWGRGDGNGLQAAGVGHRTVDHCNYLIVKPETKVSAVEEAFRDFTSRADAGIILINQHIANDIRHLTANYTQTIPTILEIPSKNHPYDPKKDYIMTRVNQMLGHQG